MELHKDAMIVTHDGREIGRLDRVALNPRSKEITHLVVRRGTLFPVDKVIEMGYVAEVTGDRIRLSPEAGDPEYLPLFEVRHYVATQAAPGSDEALGRAYAPKGYWHMPAGGAIGVPLRGVPDTALPAPRVPPAGHELHVEQNIPDTTVAVKKGARVVAEDGSAVGQVVRLVVDETTGQMTWLLIELGTLNRTQKLIPANWLTDTQENELHLLVGADVVEAVPDHSEAG